MVYICAVSHTLPVFLWFSVFPSASGAFCPAHWTIGTFGVPPCEVRNFVKLRQLCEKNWIVWFGFRLVSQIGGAKDVVRTKQQGPEVQTSRCPPTLAGSEGRRHPVGQETDQIAWNLGSWPLITFNTRIYVSDYLKWIVRIKIISNPTGLG